MKLIFDSSVWIEHLRRDALAPILPGLRGRFQLWLDGIVAAEILAGCRSRLERRVIDNLFASFRRADRVHAVTADDWDHAGRALSKLRERGVLLRNPGAALLDAGIAVSAARLGALLVTENTADFERLAAVLPLRFESLAELARRLAG